MRNISKKTKYLVGSIFLGGTLICGSAHAKDDNPTEINIIANQDKYTQLIKQNKPLHLKVYEALRLDVLVKDEDTLKSHRCYNTHLGKIYSKGPKDMTDDNKLSKEYIKLTWYKPGHTQVKIIAEDKNNKKTQKVIDIYFGKASK